MENLIEKVIKAVKKLPQFYEKFDREMPGTKWMAMVVAFSVAVAFISKPKDTSIYKMQTPELIHKYYGNEYKEGMSPKEVENGIQDKMKKYPFGRIG